MRLRVGRIGVEVSPAALCLWLATHNPYAQDLIPSCLLFQVLASGCKELQQLVVEDQTMLNLAREAVQRALMAKKGISQTTVDKYRHAYGLWPCQRAFVAVGGQFEKAVEA